MAALRAGIRLVKIGMSWPLDPSQTADLVAGAETVMVVEEKRSFVETQLKELLYSLPGDRRPQIIGKRDAHGAPLLAETFELNASIIARAIISQLPADVSTDRLDDYVARLTAEDLGQQISPSSTERTPYFCSGCPHNSSTKVPEGSRALVGIGCHYMVQWMDRLFGSLFTDGW